MVAVGQLSAWLEVWKPGLGSRFRGQGLAGGGVVTAGTGRV